MEPAIKAFAGGRAGTTAARDFFGSPTQSQAIPKWVVRQTLNRPANCSLRLINIRERHAFLRPLHQVAPFRYSHILSHFRLFSRLPFPVPLSSEFANRVVQKRNLVSRTGTSEKLHSSGLNGAE